jgi:hypothetical protein
LVFLFVLLLSYNQAFSLQEKCSPAHHLIDKRGEF